MKCRGNSKALFAAVINMLIIIMLYTHILSRNEEKTTNIFADFSHVNHSFRKNTRTLRADLNLSK